MNDRFKFRCYNKFQEKMFDVKSMSYINGIVQRIEVQDDDRILIFDEWQNNIDNTVLLQCTGLKDKNGKLIYEGDIISCQGKAVIAYSDDKALFYAHYFNIVGICEWYLFELKKIFAQCEVIGNIYENKELLEDTECQK